MAQNRRRLLQGLGLASGSLFLPSLLGRREAHAAPPLRLVVFQTSHGPPNWKSTLGTGWEFRPPGKSGADDAEWELPLGPLSSSDFSEVLRPLHPHRNDVTILEGLALTSALLAPPGNNHGVSDGHRFTCGADGGGVRTSFEMHIAERVKVPGRIPYLAYNTGSSSGTTGGHYDVTGHPLVTGRMQPGTSYLNGAYSRVFGNLPPSLPTAEPPPPPQPGTVAFSRQRRQESVAFVSAQYQKIMGRVGAEDRLKLERHRAMLDDLGRRVTEIAAIKCEKPGVPPLPDGKGSSYADILLSKFFPAAMACDLSRVAILDHGQLGTDQIGAPAALDVHQDIAHASKGGAAATYMKNYYKFHAQQFANMVAAFKSVPEGSGTMLDNSVLVWMPELANGWHDMYEIMVVIAGGLGGAIKPGRYLKYAETGPNPYPKSSGQYGARRFGLGPAHNKLYVSIMQAMGLSKNSIGVTSGTGAGYGAGMPIDLTGPLPRLKG